MSYSVRKLVTIVFNPKEISMPTAAEAPTDKVIEKIEPSGSFRVDNAALDDAPELRRRLSDSGYLFLKGLLNKDALLGVRRDILLLCQEHGWLNPSAPLMKGVYSGAPFPNYSTEYMALYRKLIKLATFNAFSHSPEIVRVFERVLDSQILPHPRNIGRISFPRHFDNTTQPHQDFFYIRGTPETYTTWIPVVECPLELGGLALLEGSHKLGFLKHEPAIGAGGNGVRTAPLGLRWLAANYEFGDFVLFHSHTIHGALDNHTADRLRISLDYRYQRAHEEIDPSSLKPHGG
jgi:hypothetical protein